MWWGQPGMIVTFGSELPVVHDGRQGVDSAFREVP